MNKFDKKFFVKYIPKGTELKGIIHEHIIVIMDKIILTLFFGTILPVFLYYYSDKLKQVVPFFALETLLFIVFIKIVYDIFNWYNDVWIITNEGVIDLDWDILDTSVISVKYESIEGIEVEQKGLMDTLLSKGDLIINRIGSGPFVLKDASVPYDAVDEIEEASRGTVDEDNEYKENHFDMIMDALGGVVEDYLEKKGIKEYDDSGSEIIEKYEEKVGTIDLR